MAETVTLAEAQAKHRTQVDDNRMQGIADTNNGETPSDKVYEVTDGLKYLPGGRVLGPGNRFRPTEEQIARGGLKGKARELSRSEYQGIGHRVYGNGADIGLRQYEMAESTLQYALEHGLTEADFDGVEPEGANGRYLREQVEAMVAARDTSTADA